MTQTNTVNNTPKGGQFLIDPVGSHSFFIPEDFTEEERFMGIAASEFCAKEVVPHARRMEEKDYELLVGALKKSGELGLCMTAVPEAWGGLGLPERVTGLVAEKVASYGTFSVTHGAHSTIGTLPIVYFGTPEQKAKYLPKLATCELIGAYALSEPGSGSDALGARTVAVLNEEGTHYVVNGTKQWITNGGFADLFVVFCQIADDEGAHHFSALIVEKDTPGFKPGKEEHKLGIRGTSTTPLHFDNALIPKENLLGVIGKGHEIAFNILNVGRFKLALGVTGGARNVLTYAIEYASERKQFKTPVINFGALRQKVAIAASEIYAMESLSYRIAGLIDEYKDEVGHIPEDAPGKVRMQPIQEYAIESSIAKVYCSEALNRVVSESLQMYGGYGYVEDYPVEMAFRDARINMIFEGTNEINRMLIPGMLLKRAMNGELPLMQWLGSLETGPQDVEDTTVMAAEINACQRIKGTTGVLMQAVAGKYMRTLESEQELLLLLSDLVMDAYIVDSAVGRTLKRHKSGESNLDAVDAATRLVVRHAADRVRTNAERLAEAAFDGEQALGLLEKINTWSANYRCNVVADQKLVADSVIGHGSYNLSGI
ncbi:MAG TPA: acyl-CoA dehydrogenase [Myxococcales bacterium]|nr:acyl-CoA dehydrogenase [Myxococcales bacterium]